MRVTRTTAVALVLSALLGAGEGDEKKLTWNFDEDQEGKIAKGFTGVVGDWVVVSSDDGKALAQTARNADPVFNLALVDNVGSRDLDLSVRFKAIAGELDQGGGLVWRAKNPRNYYIARYNPLEDNFRVYKVVDGKRTVLQSKEIAHSDGWHTLRVTMSGDHINCFYDGQKYLDVRDTTFPAAGTIGLWTKADARTQFDDLTLVEH